MADRLRVVLRELAERDIEVAVDWYRDSAAPETALDFVGSLESALARLAEHPGIGSPRYAAELNLPELRSWLLDGSPHLVFYVAQAGFVDVWRVLHAHRGIPASLADPEPPHHDA